MLPLLVASALILMPSIAQSQAAKPQPWDPSKAVGQLRIAAAADLQPILPMLAGAFEFATKIHIEISYGASSTLAQQIQNGAPFDLFLAADYSFPEQVVAADLADSREPTPYARGALVLWARKDSPFQPLTSNTLYDQRIGKLAIANPDHAPYGRAAQSALTALKLDDKLKSKLVIAENIAQAGQFADSGNAQLALISLTIANSEHYQQTGSYVRISPNAYPEIRQCAVVMKNSPNRDAAHKFLIFLTSDKIQQELPKLGLGSIQ